MEYYTKCSECGEAIHYRHEVKHKDGKSLCSWCYNNKMYAEYYQPKKPWELMN